MKKNILVSIIFLLSGHSLIHPAVKGSNLSVSVEPAFTFPAADSDNKMLGFGWFKNGFTLEDNTTTCTFASVYPVSGTIDLNGGTLHLIEDLVFKNVTTLQGLGTIVGNNRLLEFCTSISAIPSDAQRFEDVYIALSNSVTIAGSSTFAGSTIFDGRGHTVELEGVGEIVVDSNATLQLKDMILKGISGSNIRCVDDTATLILDNVKWVQDSNLTFSIGSLDINDRVDVITSSTLIYTSNKPLTIKQKSLLSVLGGGALKIGKRPSGGAVDPLVFIDASSVLHLSNCSLIITDSGLQVTKGKIICDELVDVEVLSTDTSNGLIFGDGIDGNNDVMIRLNADSLVRHSGHFTYNNVANDKIEAMSKSATLFRYNNSELYIAQNIILPSMTFEIETNAVPPMSIAEGKTLDYNKGLMIFPDVGFDITGQKKSLLTFWLQGNHELFLLKGLFPLHLDVSSTGNVVQGTGTISGNITLLDNTSELELDLFGTINQSIALNGGKITLSSDVILGPATQITGSGSIDLTTCQLHFGAQDITCNDSMQWQGAGGVINLRARLSLVGTWTLDGDIVINGHGNVLDLDTTGKLVVASGGTLTIKDIKIIGVTNEDISCQDDTSSLVLQNVTWVQDGDCTFSQGSILFVDTVDFVGSYTFLYDSAQTSTISNKSTWNIADHLELQIGKKTIGGNEPLYFEDGTSLLMLDNCSFCVTSSGMQLINGRVICNRDVSIDINSTDTSNGLILGNGVAANDMVFEFNPGASVTFKTGHVVYDVTNATNLSSHSSTAKLTRAAASTFYIKQDITLNNLTIDASPFAVTDLFEGKSFGYANCFISMLTGTFFIIGKRQNAVTNLLDGGGVIFLIAGSLPMYTTVSSIGNYLVGNGAITAPITLLDSNAVLIISMTGFLATDITLNGGTVQLGQDVQFVADKKFADSGSVDLGSNQLSLGVQDSIWTGTIAWEADEATLALRSKTFLEGQWTFDGNCTIQGEGNVLDLSQGGTIVIGEGVTLTLRDVHITGLTDGSIVWQSSTSVLKLDDVTWVQDGDFTLQQGSMYFEDVVDFNGPYTFTMDTASTSTIALKSFWNISDSMQLSIGRTSTAGPEPLYFEDDSSTLKLDNCTFNVTSNGLGLTRGRVVCTGDIDVDIQSTDTTNGLQLGDGTTAGDLLFEFDAGAVVTFRNGHVVYDVTVPDSVISHATTSKLVRLAASTFYVKQNVTLSNLTIDSSLYAVTTVTEGKSFGYENCILLMPAGSIIANAQRYNAVTNLLQGNQSIFLATGSYPMLTLISGTGNNILGNGSVTGDITLLDADSEVTISVDGQIQKDITLNGGTVCLGQDMHFSCAKQFVGMGTIGMAGNTLRLGPKDALWTGTLVWDGQGSNIELNADLTLSGVWTFSDDCVIKGEGQKIDLSTSGQVVVGADSTLRLRDVILENVHSSNFRCTDSTSKILFEDTVLVLDDDYYFTKGAFIIDGDLKLSGSHIFAYQTALTSTIDSRSIMYLENMVTFSYDPPTAAGDLLYLTDGTSKIHMNEATLHATTTGLHLIRGNLVAQNQCYLSSEATTASEAIVFGDGVSSNNDLDVDVLPESALNVLSGHVVVKNING